MAGKRKKQQKNHISVGTLIWMLLGTVIAAAIAIGIAHVVYQNDTIQEQSDAPSVIAEIPVYTDYISPDSIARPNIRRDIHYITIHETDNTKKTSNAKAHNDYLHSNCWKEQKSWHYTVDDHEIWHHLPDQEIGYHAGDNSRKEGGNRNGIGIELCVNQGGDFQRTMQNAAQLTAYLLRKYELTIDAVKKHQDFSGKECPQTIIQQQLWDDFLNMVQIAYAEQEQQELSGSV